jgi:membrane protein
MMRDRLESLLSWLRRVITQPFGELNRWQRAVRFGYDLGRFGARQLKHDRAQHMAAALSFRTLFSMLPVLVVTTLLVKGLIGLEPFLEMSEELLASVGLDTIRVVPADGVTEKSQTMSVWLKELFGQAAEVDLAAVHWIGVSLMLYAALSLMVTIENCLNVIVRAPVGRRWSRRIPLYWFVLTGSPLLVVLWYYVNHRFDMWITSVEAWQWLAYIAWLGWNLFFAWLLMLAVYMLVPSSQPEFKPAAAGAGVAAVLLVLGLRGLGAYLNYGFMVGQLYGSLGLVPLFMIWVYLMWLAVLFGLEVCAILQALPGRRLEELERERKSESLVDPATVVAVMEVIGNRFADGQPTTLLQVCEQTGLPEHAASRMFSGLVLENLLHRLDGPSDTVALAKPPEQITGVELLEVAFRLVDSGQPAAGSRLLDRLRQAQRDLVATTTLATLVQQP